VTFISIGMFPSATIADRRALDSANAMFKGIIEMEPSNTYAGNHEFSPIPSEHASHGFPNSRAAHQKRQLWTPYRHCPASPVPPRAPEIILRFIRRAVVLLYESEPYLGQSYQGLPPAPFQIWKAATTVEGRIYDCNKKTRDTQSDKQTKIV